MRSKFSELIDNGVAQFNYINIVSDLRDPICIEYNNLYSHFTDTHMAPYENGYIITGHLRGDDYDRQISCCNAGIIKGYYNIACFFREKGLCGSYSQVNGDRAYILKPCKPGEWGCAIDCLVPNCYYENNSNIPKPIASITTNNDINKVKECFNNNINSSDVVKQLNESLYIKGNNWCDYNGCIYGYINGKNIKIKID